MHLLFDSPYFLFLLLLLPCFIWCRPSRQIYYFSKLSWLPPQPLFLSWKPWLKILIFTLIVLGLAQPFTYDSQITNDRKGRDLILALDASGSMGERGFDKDNRMLNKFNISLALADDFIQKRHDDNMGVVIFGTFAYTASPLTYDLTALSSLLHFTSIGIAGESTAIGDALSQAIRTLSYGEAKQKAIILLTDGYHNAGKTSPKSAVALAKEKGIKIYTIGLGTRSDYDVALLQIIAKETQAKSYGASSAKALLKIYEEINRLEPSAIRSENYLNQRLWIFAPLSLVFILLLSWILLRQKALS